MKTTTNFISKGLLRLPASVLLLTAALLPLLTPQQATAQTEKPFNANFITKFTSVIEGNFLHVTVTGRGRSTYLCKSTAFTDNQFVSLIDGSITATYTLTGANGDTLTLDFVAQGPTWTAEPHSPEATSLSAALVALLGRRAVASSREGRFS